MVFSYALVIPQPLRSFHNASDTGASNQKLSDIQQSHPQLFELQNKPDEYRTIRDLQLYGLFIVPEFDELVAVAMDESGQRKRLSHSQLKSIRDCGYVFYLFCYQFFRIRKRIRL